MAHFESKWHSKIFEEAFVSCDSGFADIVRVHCHLMVGILEVKRAEYVALHVLPDYIYPRERIVKWHCDRIEISKVNAGTDFSVLFLDDEHWCHILPLVHRWITPRSSRSTSIGVRCSSWWRGTE